MHNLIQQFAHYLAVGQCGTLGTFGLRIGKAYEMKHLHHMHCTVVAHGFQVVTYSPAALETEELGNPAFALLGSIV